MIFNKSKILSLGIVILIGVLIWSQLSTVNKTRDFDGSTKVILRSIGHQLLLQNNDSISRVLPVQKLNYKEYKLSFESPLTLLPWDIVEFTQTKIINSNLLQNYRVEVYQCDNSELVYSTEVEKETDISLVPCKVRQLSLNCYSIHFVFLEVSNSISILTLILSFLLIIFLVFLLLDLIKSNRLKRKSESVNDFLKIGVFELHPHQNKLIQKGLEIKLSKKECEILQIFASQPNQIIKREELMKRVWEDNGVVVSRSLDTYISKLRKIMKDDENVQLVNVHGVGYKLEIKK